MNATFFCTRTGRGSTRARCGRQYLAMPPRSTKAPTIECSRCPLRWMAAIVNPPATRRPRALHLPRPLLELHRPSVILKVDRHSHPAECCSTGENLCSFSLERERIHCYLVTNRRDVMRFLRKVVIYDALIAFTIYLYFLDCKCQCTLLSLVLKQTIFKLINSLCID